MSLDLYLAFVAATLVLMAIPGPNVTLIVANSIAYGTRYGLFTVLCTSLSIIPLLAFTVAGMSAMLGFVSHWFEVLRWVGAAYLIYLGIEAWRAPAPDLTALKPDPKSLNRIASRAVLVALTNPKTLLFFGAFFPQFIEPSRDATSQLAIMAVSFFVIAVVCDSTWALGAGRLRPMLAKAGKWVNRVTGSALLNCGVGLALARRP
ncbi:MAG: LysE family translocator [Alphaproteobacteria bacterium]|nr:LysE family translocator [Alphaproteobacteria bacterium]